MIDITTLGHPNFNKHLYNVHYGAERSSMREQDRNRFERWPHALGFVWDKLICSLKGVAVEFEMDHDLSQQVQAPEALVSVAFDKAWRFVESDPILAHNLKSVLHRRLRDLLASSVRNGERNALHLANEAIRNLRAELAHATTQ